MGLVLKVCRSSSRYVGSPNTSAPVGLAAVDGYRRQARAEAIADSQPVANGSGDHCVQSYVCLEEGSFEDLLRFYEEMVQCLSNMMKAKKSMRTYVKGSIKGPLIEFSDEQYFKEDMGDGNRIAVFSTLSLHTHEMLAEELVTMFLSEIRIKWLIVSEFYHALYSDVESSYLKKKISEEMLNKTFIEANSKVPELNSGEQAHHALLEKFQQRPVALIKREVLQVYLTAWLAEVNIRRNRVEETLKAVSEEIQCKFAI